MASLDDNQSISSNSDIKSKQLHVKHPEEIRIVGKISHIYIKENSNFSIQSRPHKTKSVNRVMIPIKVENSCVQFAKVPIYKINKKSRVSSLGTARCQKINMSTGQQFIDQLSLWTVHKKELEDVELVNRNSQNNACIIFEPSSTAQAASSVPAASSVSTSRSQTSSQKSQTSRDPEPDDNSKRIKDTENNLRTVPLTNTIGTQTVGMNNLNTVNPGPSTANPVPVKKENKRSRALDFFVTTNNQK